MNQLGNFTPNPQQLAAINLLKVPGADRLLARGGRRSGKSVAWVLAIAGRAFLYPGSKHGVFRNTLNTCRQLLFQGTFIEVMEMAWPGYLERQDVVINKQDSTIRFHNGSIIFFRGLDENNTTRQRGSEYATIWLNECNEVKDYESILTLISSLNHTTPMLDQQGNPVMHQGKPLMITPKLLLDCNPQLNSDWDAQAFKFLVHPKTGLPHKTPARWREIKMDPQDNIAHQAQGYLENLIEDCDGLPSAMSTFVLGEWRDQNPDAMFRSDMVQPYCPIDRSDLVHVAVGVDPGGLSNSTKSDLTGIVVVGRDRQGIAYILADYSIAGTPDVWAPEVIKAHKAWEAHVIVAESNQGGLMVEQTIQGEQRNAPVKLIRANDGKIVRAQPVAIAYRKGRIKHTMQFKELEAQMYDFENVVAKRGTSPDRVDALVYAVSEVLDFAGSDKKPGGFGRSRFNPWL